ncbi:Delta(24)-sterol [Sarracenia purpurea var. burkii]
MSNLQAPLRPKRKKVLVDYFISLQWIFVIFVVLPISITFDFLIYLGDVRSERKSFKQRQMEHDENVKKVVKRLNQRTSKDGFVCTARNLDYKRARHFEVDLSPLRNILEIDKERMIARVEPFVTMGQITRVTVPMNLALVVVAELDDLTIGGLINGYGIEGNSHIYGLFTDTIVSYEIILADGRVVRATKDNEYSDLFYAITWSQGTLGFIVSAEIKLIPVKEYMKLTYKPVVGNLKDIAQTYIDSFAPRDRDQDNPKKVPEFVEGLVYSSTEAKALKKGEFVEYIPTRQYYHRHTRPIFWEVKLIIPFGDQWWFRFLLGWMMPPKVSLLKATQGEAIRNYYHEMHVVQDMLVPLYKLGDALEEEEKRGLRPNLPVRGAPTSAVYGGIRDAPMPPPASPPSMEPWCLIPASSLYAGISMQAKQVNQFNATKSHNQSRSTQWPSQWSQISIHYGW